jgi:cellulose synthase/poly-beta-1,6-N-acetylglucosamine synthase-like glycosyltransferase
MTFIAMLTYWISVAALVYVYVGFSMLIVVLGFVLRRKVKKSPIEPTVSVIVAAYNEERGIGDRIENLLSLDYPRQKLEIIIVSDGSTDRTNEITAGYESKGITLLKLSRRGKIFALREAVSMARGDILVFSDANSYFKPDAVSRLVPNFADKKVGGVCGNQIYIKSENIASDGENLYWRYDKWLKARESDTGSIVSADGAIYAIRRHLFRMPGSTAVTDDFALSTAVIEQGYRLVFEKEAIAYEKTAPQVKDEFGRKVRIINRGIRGVILRKKLLNPFRYGIYSLILFSHKFFRRLVPFFLIALFLANLVLLHSGVYFLSTGLAQIAFYTLAFTGLVLQNTRLRKFKLIYIPFHFCLLNAAAFVAVMKILHGERIEFWQPKRQPVEA